MSFIILLRPNLREIFGKWLRYGEQCPACSVITQRALGNKMYHHLPPTDLLLGEWVRKSETNTVRQKTVLLSIQRQKWTKMLHSIGVNCYSPVRSFACCQLWLWRGDNITDYCLSAESYHDDMIIYICVVQMNDSEHAQNTQSSKVCRGYVLFKPVQSLHSLYLFISSSQS